MVLKHAIFLCRKHCLSTYCALHTTILSLVAFQWTSRKGSSCKSAHLQPFCSCSCLFFFFAKSFENDVPTKITWAFLNMCARNQSVLIVSPARKYNSCEEKWLAWVNRKKKLFKNGQQPAFLGFWRAGLPAVKQGCGNELVFPSQQHIGQVFPSPEIVRHHSLTVAIPKLPVWRMW